MVLVPHKMVYNGVNYSMLAPDIYANIKDAVGISKLSENDNTAFAGRVDIAEFAASGKIFRLRLSLDNKKSRFIYCAGDKVQSALGGCVNKTVEGSKVRTVRIPRRAVFS